MEYKVGDKVRILPGAFLHGNFKHGDTGEIIQFLEVGGGGVVIESGDEKGVYYFKEIEPAKEPAKEPDEEPVPAHLMIRKIQRAKEE